MPSTQDLCLLQDLKAWIWGNSTDSQWPTVSDLTLSAYISSASRAILAALQRPNLTSQVVNEVRSGVGGPRLMLRQYPVTSLISLNINGQVIPQRPPLGSTPNTVFSVGGPVSGWVIENPWDGEGPGQPASLVSEAPAFYRGAANINISYNAGYSISNEAAQVPPTGPYDVVPLAPYGEFRSDCGVTYANGTALTAVSSMVGLSCGQYVPPSLPPGTGVTSQGQYVPNYIFSTYDAGAPVLISYSFTPYELTQATLKWVGEWWSYRTRVGEKSRALPQGGGTASYDLSAMPQDVKMLINPYKRLITP